MEDFYTALDEGHLWVVACNGELNTWSF